MIPIFDPRLEDLINEGDHTMPKENKPTKDSLPETVTIKKSTYNKLVSDSEFLSALHACGVDNWEGYDNAVEINELSEK